MRTIELTVPPTATHAVVDALRDLEPLGMRVLAGVSIDPPGDVVVVSVTNERLRDVMRVADDHGLGQDPGVSISTSQPLSVITASRSEPAREIGATTWEELEVAIGEDSTMTLDRVIVMFFAGVIAGLGLISGTLHAIVGAMIIAPGFQPLARIALGVINRSHAWRGGLLDAGRAYGALATGGLVVAGLSTLLGEGALDAGNEVYLGEVEMIAFWSTFSWTGIVTGAAAALCGGILISLNRSVLTAGVMVALALVPGATLVPMALVAGEFALAGTAALRFLTEVALVLTGTALAFRIKRHGDRRYTSD